VRQWLATAAAVPGFIGFAVGGATLWEPLVNYRSQRITRGAAVEQIAASYREWVDLFEKAKYWTSGSSDSPTGGPTLIEGGACGPLDTTPLDGRNRSATRS
jgi:hypothetical protein